MVHGFTDSVQKWWSEPKHFINLPTVLDKAAADLRPVEVQAARQGGGPSGR